MAFQEAYGTPDGGPDVSGELVVGLIVTVTLLLIIAGLWMSVLFQDMNARRRIARNIERIRRDHPRVDIDP